ncbi:MAG: SPOR domain-containing protein [Syntrophobacterales bacterium]|jgi:hypothetical protein|nr:SPOR domain-containing protein [Syntrophobacterales bacterium]
MEKNSFSHTCFGARKDSFLCCGHWILILFLLLAGNMVYAPSCQAKEPKKESARYSVPIASYQNIRMVTTEINRLKEQNYPAYYEEITQDKKKTFRVFAGPYSTKQKADAEAAKLKRAGLIRNVQVVSASGASSGEKPADAGKEKQTAKEANKPKDDKKNKKDALTANGTESKKETTVTASKAPQKEKSANTAPIKAVATAAKPAEEAKAVEKPVPQQDISVSSAKVSEVKPVPAATEKKPPEVNPPGMEAVFALFSCCGALEAVTVVSFFDSFPLAVRESFLFFLRLKIYVNLLCLHITFVSQYVLICSWLDLV